MRFNLMCLVAAASMVFFSCQDNNDTPKGGNDHIILNTDGALLSARLKKDNTGVINITSEASSGSRMLEDEAGTLPLELIAHVEAPVYEGNVLQATHVDIEGDYAYVTYNSQGAKYLGAIDIFDISDVLNPVIKSQAIFEEADLNAVDYVEGKLYIAAAADQYGSYKNVEGPANLITVSVANGQFTSDFTFTTVEGYVGTDVNHTLNHVILSSGTRGWVSLINKEDSSVEEFFYGDDLRSIVFGADKVFALDGKSGVYSLDPVSLNGERLITLPEDASGAKRTMDYHEKGLLVSEGANGVGMYSVSDGTELSRVNIPVVSDGLVDNEVVTNAVSAIDKHFFMANGAAGVSAVELDEEVTTLGVLDLFGSSNYVRADDDYLFVASGLQGLQILKINLAEEIADVVCTDFPAYTGGNNMNINSGENVGYAGSLVLKGANVNASLTFCGSLAVENHLNVNSNGEFYMSGSLAVGKYGKKNTGLNLNGKMVVKGSMVVYGNMNMNSGSELEFVGEGASITVYGEFRNNGGEIKGEYTDTQGKLN